MSEPDKEFEPAIVRARVAKLTLFEVTEAELEALEGGSLESIFLNLAIATISIAVSFFTSLVTATITSIFTFCVFVIICVASFIAGVTFFLLWWTSRRTGRNVARQIRSRVPPVGIPASADPKSQI
jgi:hypothetical protein